MGTNLNLLKIKIIQCEKNKEISSNIEYKKLEEKIKMFEKNLNDKICEIKKNKEEIFTLIKNFGKCKEERESFRQKYLFCTNETSTIKKISEERKTLILTCENKLAEIKNENKKCSNKLISLVETYSQKITVLENEKKILKEKLKNKKNCTGGNSNSGSGSGSSTSNEYYLKYQLLVKEKENFIIKINECEKDSKKLYEK